MGLDPSEVLLKKARDDARLPAALENSADASEEQIGFFAQQVVEKSIKFVLTTRGVAYRRTHDLAELIDLLGRSGIVFPDELRESVSLTPFAVQFRYDDLAEGENAKPTFDRHIAVRIGRGALKWAQTFLSISAGE